MASPAHLLSDHGGHAGGPGLTAGTSFVCLTGVAAAMQAIRLAGVTVKVLCRLLHPTSCALLQHHETSALQQLVTDKYHLPSLQQHRGQLTTIRVLVILKPTKADALSIGGLVSTVST